MTRSSSASAAQSSSVPSVAEFTSLRSAQDSSSKRRSAKASSFAEARLVAVVSVGEVAKEVEHSKLKNKINERIQARRCQPYFIYLQVF